MSNAIEPKDVDNTKQKQPEQIRVEVVQEKDTEEILNMLKAYFFKDEPMNNYLNMGDCVELEKYATKSIGEQCSFKALNSRGEIIGVAMNSIVKKPKPDQPFHSYAADCNHPQFKKILTLMEYIDHQYSTFNLYPDIDKFLDATILSVDANYRGYGVAGKLMEATMQYMRDNKITVFQVLCSSYFSARVCEKMGFKKVYVLPFVDYKVDGVNPILPAEPHKAIQILVKEIH
ncbi:arylalkylamine N-acetyltransferase 1 isoform X2 [Sitodiplosis mosellana]|nr:arylalkylamine N-acetyltransferase 1 isoform X2 [Sitodiplosis mosellana]XP_055316709.1 arylalkylamine N-acetyltransferase 1 isoform X2 [Sitodiplosis mosellana]XP_055316710.1 arylalkylamine N-acetyltransferase 1 isoform X2 [Sitodiplosis mosellana]